MKDKYETKKVLREAVSILREKILKRGDLPYISVKDQLKYLDGLLNFAIGRELLEKKSIDTNWTDFIINSKKHKSYSNLEDFILNRSPFIIAWRELLYIFQQAVQNNLREDMVFASIPCGGMREILELNNPIISKIKIIGVDIDPASLLIAKQIADQKNMSKNVYLLQQDAWNLPYNSEIDLIASCGLNIYEPNKSRVLDLYSQFYHYIKPGGKLVLGFLTYPPWVQGKSEWKITNISSADLILERVLFEDILDVQWHNFRTSNEVEKELKSVGFSEIIFRYDSMHVFPTAIAQKS